MMGGCPAKQWSGNSLFYTEVSIGRQFIIYLYIEK